MAFPASIPHSTHHVNDLPAVEAFVFGVKFMCGESTRISQHTSAAIPIHGFLVQNTVLVSKSELTIYRECTKNVRQFFENAQNAESGISNGQIGIKC